MLHVNCASFCQLAFTAIGTVLVLGFTSSVDAAGVDFEDISVPAGSNDIAGDRTSTGFLFDSLANHTHLVNNNFGVFNNTTYLVTDDFTGINPLTMSRVGGGVFALGKADIAEWSDTNETARTVSVTGNLLGGGTVATTLTLDLVFDGAGSAVDFQTFSFNATWTNLLSVVFKGNGSITGNNYFSLDNIVTNAVPEPTTLAMGSFVAICGLTHVRRRRRSSSVTMPRKTST